MRLPSWVINGTTVLPAQSQSARNVATGGATVDHQQGEPTKITSYGLVFGGVGFGRNDLEKVAVRRFGDLPRHGARIAAVGEIGHQHLRAGCGLRLCIHIG